MELARWFIFSVIFGMLPVYFRLFYGLARKSENVSFIWLFAGGELLLVSTVIGCNALGRIMGVETSYPLLGLISTAACLLLLVVSSFWFADISVAKSNVYMDKKMVSYGSAILFGANVVASACCVYCVI